MANGDLIKLGTLHMNGAKQLRPTKPWRTNSVPPGAPSVGNIPSYIVGATLDIKDTDAIDGYKMQWVEVNGGESNLLIGDCIALVNISHDDLKALGLIEGKEVTIDGKQYLLRILTGGNDYRTGSYTYSGGKLPNEWDKYITNEGNIPGLLKPSSKDLDSTADAADFNGTHNKLWNWFYTYSWCQETYVGNVASRVHRGNDSARNWIYSSSTTRTANLGWRPVLELLDTAPNISGSDEDLGPKTKNFEIKYQVDDPELENIITIKESLNGEEIKTITPAERNVDYTINIHVYDLEVGEHTITIQATNNDGGDTLRTYTFTRASLKKFLIDSEEGALTLDSLGELEVIKDSKPIKDDFLEHGFEDEELTSFDLSKLSVFTKPNLLIYSEELDPKLKLKAIPKAQLVKPTDDIKLKMLSKINTMTLTSNKTGQGVVKIIFSVDSGVTWKTYNSETLEFEDVETIDIKNVKEKGINADIFNSLNTKWNEVVTEGKIRFAYYLEIENEDDIANVDKLEINMDLTGKWKKAIHATDYDYEYDNEHIYVTFNTDGSYKVNYAE